MALCADDVKSTDVRDARAKFNIRPTTRHVRGDSDATALSSARDDFSFLLVIFGIEDRVDDSGLLQHARNLFARFNRNCADKNRAAKIVNGRDLLEHRAEFLA